MASISDAESLHTDRVMTGFTTARIMRLPYARRENHMAGKGQLVLAFFESEEAADTAVDALNQWAKTNRRVELDAIGVLAKDDAGNVKTHKLGPREGRKGLGVGAVLGAIAAIVSPGLTLVEGAALGGAGGGLVGSLFRKDLGLTNEDAARIASRLDAGHAAVGVLVPANQAAVIADELEALGGEAEQHTVAAPQASPAGAGSAT